MSLYVIAEIVKDDRDSYFTERVGYRVYDNKSMKYIDASKESIIKKLNNGTIINGLKFNSDKEALELTYGHMSMSDYTLDSIVHNGETPSWLNKKLWTVIFKSDKGIMAVSSKGVTRLISYESIKHRMADIRFTNFYAHIKIDNSFEVGERDSIDVAQLRFNKSEKVKNVIGKLEVLGTDAYTVDYDGTFLLLDKNVIHVNVPSVCKRIPKNTFESSRIESIHLGSGVKSLETRSFINCSRLTFIEIPGNVKRIGANCFMGCDNLSKVILHDGVEHIYRAAFGSCHNLKYIKLPRTLKDKIDLNIILLGIDGTVCVDIPTELRENLVPVKKDVKRSNVTKKVLHSTEIKVRFY